MLFGDTADKMLLVTADFKLVLVLAISTKQRYLTFDWCRHLVNWTKHTRRL